MVPHTLVQQVAQEERDRSFGLFSRWLQECGVRANESDFQTIYKEGWIGAVYDLRGRMDDWKKKQRELEK